LVGLVDWLQTCPCASIVDGKWIVVGDTLERFWANVGGPFVAALLAIATPCISHAGGVGDNAVSVTVDKEAWRARDEGYRIDGVKAQIDRALHPLETIEISTSDEELSIYGSELAADGPDMRRIQAYFADKPQFTVTAHPVEIIRITYSPQGLKAFGGDAGAAGAHDATPREFAEQMKDLPALEPYIRYLGQPLPGFRIEGTPDGAIVHLDRAEDSRALSRAMSGKLSGVYVSTRIDDNTWRVGLDSEIRKGFGPAGALRAGATTEFLLREELRDPIDLRVDTRMDGVEVTVPDPDLHAVFVDAVRSAFAANKDFVATFRTSQRLAVTVRPGSPDADGSLAGAREAVSHITDPPIDIAPISDGIVVQAKDAARNADRAAVIRKALADRRDLMLATLPDQSLSIRFASDVSPIAPIAAGRLARVVQARLDGLKLHASAITSGGNDTVAVRFATAADAQALRMAIRASAFGFAIRVVDGTPGGAVGDAPPSPGDSRLRQARGADLWVRPEAPVTGEMIADAWPGEDANMDMPDVEFRLTGDGAQRFAALTAANVGRPLAIVLDGVILEAPTIRTEITGGSGDITGGFTPQSARALAQSILTYSDDLPLEVTEGAPAS
jgi:hypothetical protein